MTLDDIKNLKSHLPSGIDDGKNIISICNKVNSKYSYSIHITNEQTGSKFNIWFCKFREKASISFWDGFLDMNLRQNHFKQNSNVFETYSIVDLKKEINKCIKKLQAQINPL